MNPPSPTPPRPPQEQFKAAPKITMEQLLACVTALKSNDDRFKDRLGKIPYEVRVVETEQFIYVSFSPDHERIKGAVYGGGLMPVIDKKTNKVVTTFVDK